MSAFCLFVDRFLIDHVQKCTEIEARAKTGDDNWNISTEEIYGLLATMYARGLLATGQPVELFWSKKWGSAIFRDTMSRDRYREILKFTRFDVRSTRSQRLMTDKLALVSTMWNRFIENCKASYRPGENITIDEQLFPTKAR